MGISNRFSELQGKYVYDFDNMSYSDLNAFLTLLENNPDAYNRNRRIDRIRRRLDDLERIKEREKSDKERWQRLAIEDKERKERWMRLGASFYEKESMVTWVYGGEPFYTWFSQALLDEEIIQSRKADELFNELLEADQ